MSDRDRKLLMGLIPIVVLVAFWFLLFSPKREEAATAKTELTQQQERLQAAKAVVGQANASKTDFAADYGEIVRLGKAIPAQVDMPSLLLQLDGAARGSGIQFTKISAGAREAAVVATPPAASAGSDSSSSTSTSSSSSAPPVAAGGETAQSAPGGATEAANNAAATSNTQAAAASGVNPADAQTSTSTGSGLPIGGGAAATGDATAAPAPAGLDTVPLELEFTGDFFHLANFFHQVKRFVHVVNSNVLVNGRLVTIQTVKYTSSADTFPAIKAEVTATVYLSPKAEGVTAGATPQGPASPTTTPASAPAPSSTPAPPTAAATP